MSISILNTDSNMNAKTAVLAENADTITGLKTFDRDPSAPFAVTSASAVVPNLDADKVDGYNASPTPTSYTPTLTNFTKGGGSMSAAYSRLGYEVRFRFAITFDGTSTFSAGTWAISLPITADASGYVSGYGYCYDSSVTTYYLGLVTIGTTTCSMVTHGATSFVTSTVPFTWATSDQLFFFGHYYAASAL